MARRQLLRTILTTTIVGGALLAPGAASAAEHFYATTPGNDLVSFTSEAPNRIAEREALNGMSNGETVVGLDMRPATGQLYGLTSLGRVVVINPVSGDVKQVGTPLTLTGTQFGFDFNPQVDRIRITSDADMNLRAHPDTGALAATDGMLAYGAGDAGAGSNPEVGGSGYTLGVFGKAAPATTTLFDVDPGRDVLVRQDPPNAGTLVTVGSLGVDAAAPVQFDISGGQVAYAAFAVAGQAGVRLHVLDTATGTASAAARAPRIGVDAITSLAAFGEVTDDRRAPAVAIGNYTTIRGVWASRGLNFTLSCPEECDSDITLRLGNRVLGTTDVQLDAAGTSVARIPLGAVARSAATGATGRVASTLTFRTRDAAGNLRTQVTRFASVD